MNLARRLFIWFIRFTLKVAFWGVLVAIVVRVANRGVGETVGDVVGWWGEVEGVWRREFERYEGVGREGRGGGGGWKM